MMMSASIGEIFLEAARLAIYCGQGLFSVKGVAISRRYHLNVSRLFILFLIVLLPLRGWTAERMVFVMDAAPAAAVSQAGDSDMSAGCALHLSMMDTTGDQHAAHHGAAPVHGNDHKSCESCQLCMPLVALDAGDVALAAAMPEAVPVPRIGKFVSADSARDAKPPIS
jgi:hypothetical protein